MQPAELKELRSFLEAITREAGEYAHAHFGTLTPDEIHMKKPQTNSSPVTSVDLYIDTFLREQILARYPSHDVITEEAVAKNDASEITWIIDPIDGTRNYMNKNPNYCISVAVRFDQHVELGAIYAPEHDEFFVAQKGGGVTLNGKPLVRTTPSALYYVDHRRLKQSDITKVFGETPSTYLGSAALEIAYVAAGRSQGTVLEHIMIWDVAAGVLMAQEMGCVLENFEGKPYTLVASNLLVKYQ